MELMRQIIGAVETGGHVLGQLDYGAFTEAYENSSEEYAITIGAYQMYAEEAQQLLKDIYNADRQAWESQDTLGLLDDVLYGDWSCYNIARISQKAKLIVKLISSPLGIRVQDAQIDRQIEQYLKDVRALGVTDEAAACMAANWEHQGGLGAVKRILGKIHAPYTLDSLYEACRSDTGNQVGAYRARQTFVYNTLKEAYSNMTTTESAIKWMEDLAADNDHGYDQTYRWGEKGDYDCSSAVFTAWQQAGVPVKTYSFDKYGCAYTGSMRGAFLANGFEDVTAQVDVANRGYSLLKRGDILLNQQHHVAMYCGEGMEVEASINEKGGANGGQPGDQTGREILVRPFRNYPWDVILRYKEQPAAEVPKPVYVNVGKQKFPILKPGHTGLAVKYVQLATGAEADGEFGPATGRAVQAFKKKHGMKSTSTTVGADVWRKIIGGL